MFFCLCWCFLLVFFFFFFFQAEDGIRDLTVTGVQTCALPISGGDLVLAQAARRLRAAVPPSATVARWGSEERRVGKECRSRWSPYPYKKKKEKQNRQIMRLKYQKATLILLYAVY